MLGRKVVLRGAGRSYGDPAYAAEAIALDLTRMRRVLAWDSQTGVVDVEPGVTIDQLWRAVLPDGWWCPVASGTSFVTLGGALAMNIHGKNNVMRGTLGEHVDEIDVMDTHGEIHCLRASDPRFRVVVSGLGLCGIITRIRLRLKRIRSGYVAVHAVPTRNWMETLDAFVQYAQHEYRVGWVDLFAKGDASGRGLFHAADHLIEEAEHPLSLQVSAQELPSSVLGVDKRHVWKVLRLFNHRAGLRFLNAAKFHASRLAPHGAPKIQSIVGFNFLLDYVPGWERAYGKHGFVQVQCFVPFSGALACFGKLAWIQQFHQWESNLGVVKQHRSDDFNFTHGVDGFSLAMDFRLNPKRQREFGEMVRQMHETVLEAGGRFYLAKDEWLTAEQFRQSVGEEALVRFAEVRREFDPARLLTSAMDGRLALPH